MPTTRRRSDRFSAAPRPMRANPAVSRGQNKGPVRIHYQEAGKGSPPARLKEEITNAEIDLKAQQGLLEAKKKEAASINARYDDDRKRYAEATGRRR